jgi:hypothetical protein
MFIIYCACVLFSIVLLTCDFRGWWVVADSAVFVGYLHSFFILKKINVLPKKA